MSEINEIRARHKQASETQYMMRKPGGLISAGEQTHADRAYLLDRICELEAENERLERERNAIAGDDHNGWLDCLQVRNELVSEAEEKLAAAEAKLERVTKQLEGLNEFRPALSDRNHIHVMKQHLADLIDNLRKALQEQEQEQDDG